MTPQEYKSRYAGLSQQQVRELVRTDADFRRETEALYVSAFREQLNKSCSDCWLDAYVLLMKTDTKILNGKRDVQFELKAGALLQDMVAGDNAKMCTRHNLTDELALYHLATNPGCRRYFARVPDNLDELLAQYIAKRAAQLASAAPESTEGPSDDKSIAPTEKAPEKAEKTAEETVKIRQRMLKGAQTRLANLESAEERDEKKIEFARESVERAQKALEEALAALKPEQNL